MDREKQTLEVQEHVKQTSALILLFEPEIEAIHLIAFVWLIEQIRLTIESNWESNPTKPFHSVQMASMRSMENDHRRIHSIIRDLESDPPNFPSMNLLKLLFWNCRGAGNKNFKGNITDILRTYKPKILILMETKVPYSKMGNFFNRLGFTASTIVDPVGRVGGLWIIWDTSHVNAEPPM
ncbi:hypothetical protein LOK49_LG04G03861 [Camellia lanceoleosa]|uniref:Uncharacterized protein n=1 Tax=Camellia lanceoleosa TaxID=1840588 RepID=A0ACC0HVT2_9ERIC|nr:hypothetical protein LOK49_LG04G03861 [Camellia lanceoleosa]